jgi:hypothetical protein
VDSSRFLGAFTFALVFHIIVTFILSMLFYLIVRKSGRVTYWKVWKQVAITGIVPSGILVYTMYTHGIYLDLVRDVLIMWGVFALVYAAWVTTKYKVKK